MTLENFIVDYETYKNYFNEIKKKDESSTLFGNNDGNLQVKETIFNIIELIINIINDTEIELIALGAKGLLYLLNIISYDDNKKDIKERLERFKKYLEKRIEEDKEKSIDEYFTHIGDYFYAKTYIGFKSIKDLDTFMKFDRTILSKAFFPNFGLTVVALVFTSLGLGMVVIFFFVMITEKERQNSVHEFNMFQSFFLIL